MELGGRLWHTTPMEIDEGVHAIESLGIGRAYIYQEQDRLTLIDTGLPNSADKIFAVVEKIGRKPEDLRQIFITHHHRDHTGSLANVIERSNAQVDGFPAFRHGAIDRQTRPSRHRIDRFRAILTIHDELR